MANEHFEVILADDEVGKQLHYELRYKVFCVETGFEDPSSFPDRQESDEWDIHASHFLVRERNSGSWVAAMRLVLPGARNLPVETLARIDAPPQTEHCAEISRLCMIGHYRRRLQGQALLLDVDQAATLRATEFKRRYHTAEILRVLLDAAVSHSRDYGIQYWYMLTTRALAKVCGQVLPMRFRQVGPVCLHRGERYPYLVNVDEIFQMPHLIARPCFRLHSILMEEAANAARALIAAAV